MRRALLIFSLSAAATVSYGDVKLPPLISDNMLLQKGKALVWGSADPGEKVTVKFGKDFTSTTAGKDGKWKVHLEGLKPSESGNMTVSGKNTIVIKNVAVGEVWICSGQSNMEWPVERAKNAQEEISTADSTDIRMFTVKKHTAGEPQPEVEGHWEVCSPQTVGTWSAVGYFFGRQLHDDLGTPVALIQSSWDGTPAQSWIPRPTLQADPQLKEYLTRWQAVLEEYPEAKQRYDKLMTDWKAATEKAKTENHPAPRKPFPPRGPGHPHEPSSLWNGMIAGIVPYTVKGVVWYQGESNVGDSIPYQKVFGALIQSWRKAWGTELPFYFVQIANFLPARDDVSDSNWALVRDEQRKTLALPNTGMAVAIDLGEARNIHPLNKQEVGRRLALIAEAKSYNKSIVSSGPLMEKVTFSGGAAQVFFKPDTAKGLSTKDGGPVKGFELAGADHKFVWAGATIRPAGSPAEGKPSGKKGKASEHKGQGKEPVVVVSSVAVPKPVAVRYAWADNPDVNLVNKTGLPASPFRTDDWPQHPLPYLRAATAVSPKPEMQSAATPAPSTSPASVESGTTAQTPAATATPQPTAAESGTRAPASSPTPEATAR